MVECGRVRTTQGRVWWSEIESGLARVDYGRVRYIRVEPG